MEHNLKNLLAPEQASHAVQTSSPSGIVYLVGAGPGDPDLLTLKAARLLQLADVVVYDNLVSPGVISLIHSGAEKIYVGKQTNRHTLPQAEINLLLVKLVLENTSPGDISPGQKSGSPQRGRLLYFWSWRRRAGSAGRSGYCL